jgi:hypothetical protein
MDEKEARGLANLLRFERFVEEESDVDRIERQMKECSKRDRQQRVLKKKFDKAFEGFWFEDWESEVWKELEAQFLSAED